MQGARCSWKSSGQGCLHPGWSWRISSQFRLEFFSYAEPAKQQFLRVVPDRLLEESSSIFAKDFDRVAQCYSRPMIVTTTKRTKAYLKLTEIVTGPGG